MAVNRKVVVPLPLLVLAVVCLGLGGALAVAISVILTQRDRDPIQAIALLPTVGETPVSTAAPAKTLDPISTETPTLAPPSPPASTPVPPTSVPTPDPTRPVATEVPTLTKDQAVSAVWTKYGTQQCPQASGNGFYRLSRDWLSADYLGNHRWDVVSLQVVGADSHRLFEVILNESDGSMLLVHFCDG